MSVGWKVLVELGQSLRHFFSFAGLGGGSEEPCFAFVDGVADGLGDVGHLIDADEGVHFGEKLGEFVAEALGEATGDDESLAGADLVAELGRFENGVDAFFLGGVDEGAGIDDDHVRLGGIVDDFDAVLNHGAEHNFGIDKIFSAAQGDHAHADGGFGRGRGVHRKGNLTQRREGAKLQVWGQSGNVGPGTRNRGQISGGGVGRGEGGR